VNENPFQPPVGGKAAMILGLLGHPMTTGEMHKMVKKAIPMLDTVEKAFGEFGTVPIDEGRQALEELAAGGKTEIWKELVKLEKRGLVRRAIVNPNEPHLWWRV
jgi:RIO-like serine/threonine protein kinase